MTRGNFIAIYLCLVACAGVRAEEGIPMSGLAPGTQVAQAGAAVGAPPTSTKGIYSPIGKRDPFRPILSDLSQRDPAKINPLSQFAIEQFQLRAILKGGGKSRAMFEDPEGRSHIVHEGDIFGREEGTVSRILDSEVIVTERTFNYLGEESLYERIISLPQK